MKPQGEGKELLPTETDPRDPITQPPAQLPAPGVIPGTTPLRPGHVASATLGSGEPVLFLQGLGLAGSAWLPQVRALAQHYTCAWYDNRGIANTPAPDGRVTIASLVRDAIELLDALGWQRVHLIGQSMGGVIAQELALRDPARVRSLALLCTFRRGRDVMIPRLGWWPHGLRALIGSPEACARALPRLLASQQEIARDGIDSIATRLAEEFGRPVGQRPDVAVAQFRALATHAGNTELSALHRLPSLVISGADDPLAPSSGGRRLATAIAARRFVELPHASHALPILRHEAVNALLLEHLSTP